MYVTYQALDRVNYETLQASNDHERLLRHGPHNQDVGNNKGAIASLQELSAKRIVSSDVMSHVGHAIQILPSHLHNKLLKSAIQNDKTIACVVIISEWASENLCLMDVYPEGRHSLFSNTSKFDNTIFMALVRRSSVKEKCNLNKLDLRQFTLNSEFKDLLVRWIPFMCLNEVERNPKQLTQHLLRCLSERVGSRSSLLTPGNPFIAETMRLMEMSIQESQNKIHIPPGNTLTIQVDRLDFSRNNLECMYAFMVMGCLQAVLPYCVEAQNLYIKTNVDEDEKIMDSQLPFLALLGQKTQVLKGLSLNNMKEMLFQSILQGVVRFRQLQALDVSDCSISISGNTRQRELLRERIVNLFSGFTHIMRLDLSYSDLQGHLGTLLDALVTPLQYLNISDCALKEDDLKYLSTCKHRTSLKEIILNSLVSRGEIRTVVPVLNCLEHLITSVVVAAIQSNEIDDTCTEQLCNIISKSSTVKVLDTLYNFLSVAALLQLTASACKCRTLRVLTINHLPVLGGEQEEVVHKRQALQGKVQDVLERNDRSDITVVVVAIGVDNDDEV